MNLADLQALAEDQAKLRRATKLANDLARLDAKRAGIVAELALLGITAERPQHDDTVMRLTIGGHSPTVSVGAVGSSAPPAAVVADFPAAYAEARRRLLGPWLKDFENGILGSDPEEAQKRLDEQERRRKDDITALAREILAGEAPENCVRCGEAATTTVAGKAYCETHAAAVPRLARPAGLAA